VEIQTRGCICKENMKAPAICRTLCKYDRSRKLGWQQYTLQPTQTPHTILCTLFLRGRKQPTCIHQIMYWIIREYIYMCIFLLQIIIQ
jgi:hypothetical protein